MRVSWSPKSVADRAAKSFPMKAVPVKVENEPIRLSSIVELYEPITEVPVYVLDVPSRLSTTDELSTHLMIGEVNTLSLPGTLMVIEQLPAHAIMGLTIELPFPVTLTVIVQLSCPAKDPPVNTFAAPESRIMIWEVSREVATPA